MGEMKAYAAITNDDEIRIYSGCDLEEAMIEAVIIGNQDEMMDALRTNGIYQHSSRHGDFSVFELQPGSTAQSLMDV